MVKNEMFSLIFWYSINFKLQCGMYLQNNHFIIKIKKRFYLLIIYNVENKIDECEIFLQLTRQYI